MFVLSDLQFEPGLYANRSKKASRGRFVDGNLVRFPDGVPQQVGGWIAPPVAGGPLTGRARAFHAWRPNNQVGRYAAIGTHTAVWQFDGGALQNITPAGIGAGRLDSILGAGYGAGLYGAEAWGTGRTTSMNVIDATTWTFDTWGEILLGCFTGDGVIYEQATPSTVMTALANAPSARAVAVSDERHIFAFGAAGVPGSVKFADRDNRTLWTPAAGNRAGGFEVQVTAPFQCGHSVGGRMLGWTGAEVYAFAPLNSSLVYDRERIGTKCGAAGPQSVVVVSTNLGEIAFWMGTTAFWLYDGLIREMECELQDYVFNDINVLQRAKFHVKTNRLFQEVWFFYCSANSNEIDRAVIYCYKTNTWSKAIIARTAWLDTGIFPRPLAVDPNGTIYEHENGSSAAGSAMGSYILTHPLTIGAGQRFTELSDFWPDMEPTSGSCEATFICRDYPGAPDMIVGPFPFTPATEKIDLAISTRQVQIKIAGVSGYWELGAPMFNRQAGGRR